MRVLAVGLQQFLVGEGGTKIHLMMAFATLVVTPILIFYFFTQKFFTEGIARSGIKG
jgi:ABC-type glycerol-3-phosphate transport system permease component